MTSAEEQIHPAVNRWLDTIMDAAVLPGYSRFGAQVRRHWWPADPAPRSMHGRVAVITGANSGIGAAAATDLAELGATVVLVVRDRERGGQVRDRLAERFGADRAPLVQIDVSDRDSVAAGAAEIGRIVDRVDVLVHCAGVLPEQRSVTAEGDELTLATHVLGPVLLTERLAPLLARADAARIVFVSSGGAYTQPLRADDPQYASGAYRGATAYARTKRMQIALAPLWAQHWARYGAQVAVMHPGWVHTPGIVAALPRFHRLTRRVLRTPEQGADTIVWLAATATPWPSGRFWHDRRIRPTHRLPGTGTADADAPLLWAYCLAWMAGRETD